MPHVPNHPAYWVTDSTRHNDLEAAFFSGSPDAKGKNWLLMRRLRSGGEWRDSANSDGYDGVDLPAELKRRLPNSVATQADLGAGDYHPLIWRVGAPDAVATGDDARLLTRAAGAVGLFDKLALVFRFLEPTPANANAYGHETRELLILAATEVEAAFRGILETNDYLSVSPKPHRWSTRDFVKLQDPLRLADYEVRLSLHPHWPPIEPFAGWVAKNSTASLPWYAAYNATKHDRDQEFRAASLESVTKAVAAVYVLVVAQFGLWVPEKMAAEFRKVWRRRRELLTSSSQQTETGCQPALSVMRGVLAPW